MNKLLLISPSGNLYGSEKVLLDYLRFTKLNLDIAVPKKSLLEITLRKEFPNITIRTFSNEFLWKFYFKVFFDLLAGRIHVIYCNEGGHLKYILWLSKLFKNEKFVVHIRIVEDTKKSRWILEPGNNFISLSISDWLKSKLPYDSKLIYDPYSFSLKTKSRANKIGNQMKVGVIGRVTPSKGLDRLLQLVSLLQIKNRSDQYRFLLFGDISPDAKANGWIESLSEFSSISFMGYYPNKDDIYAEIDIIFHFSTQEALGRIALEAIDYLIPFAGMKAAGIAELGNLFELEEYLADPEKGPEDILRVLESIRNNYDLTVDKMIVARETGRKYFDPSVYSSKMDKVLTS